MARLMVSLGMLLARALSTAVRRRGLPAGSPPPLAATVISLSNLVQPLDFFASEAALVCLSLDHRLWPDIRHLTRSWRHNLANTRIVATQGERGLRWRREGDCRRRGGMVRRMPGADAAIA